MRRVRAKCRESAEADIDALLAVRESRTCPERAGTALVAGYDADSGASTGVCCESCDGKGLVESGGALVALLVERGEIVITRPLHSGEGTHASLIAREVQP